MASDSALKTPFVALRLRGNELNGTAPVPFLRAPCTPRPLRKSGGPRGAPRAPGERRGRRRSARGDAVRSGRAQLCSNTAVWMQRRPLRPPPQGTALAAAGRGA